MLSPREVIELLGKVVNHATLLTTPTKHVIGHVREVRSIV